MIDHNPLLLFDLRGISETLISDKIKKHINITHDTRNNIIMPITPSKDTEEVNIKSFWGSPNKKFKTSLSVKIPSVLVRKAGVNPSFWYKKKSFLDCMNNIYNRVNRSWISMIK